MWFRWLIAVCGSPLAIRGDSIDLWNAVAAAMNIKCDYRIMPNVGALMEAVRANSTDVGVSGVFITADRDQYADFSVSILNAGMQVMVRGTGDAPSRTHWRNCSICCSPGSRWYGLV